MLEPPCFILNAAVTKVPLMIYNRLPVWSSNEATIFIFLEDAIGTPTGMASPWEMTPDDTPALEYIFGDGISVSQTRNYTRRMETGKSTYTLVDDGMKYACTIGGMHCRRQEIENIGLFVPMRRFSVVFYLATLIDRIGRIQQHVLKHALFNSASISTSDNAPIVQNVKIEAEDFIQYE